MTVTTINTKYKNLNNKIQPLPSTVLSPTMLPHLLADPDLSSCNTSHTEWKLLGLELGQFHIHI